MNGTEYPFPYFLDTTILVYTFHESDPRKQELARQLVRVALQSRQVVISTQVVQEFLNVALRRFERPMTVSEAREYLDTVLMPMCRHFPSITFYQQALLLKEETGFSFYDSLIVAAAIESGCHILLSEDLQDGRVVHGTKIVNPFA
jgi:predicted nucleic acid-binding protein